MSNNDLRCSKCGTQHHPVECPAEAQMTDREKLVEIIHRTLFNDPVSERNAVRNLELYALADAILKFINEKYIHKERAKDLKDKLDEAIEHLSVFLDDEPCQFDHHGYCQAHGFLGPEPGCGTADAIKFVKAIANSHDVIKGEEDE